MEIWPPTRAKTSSWVASNHQLRKRPDLCKRSCRRASCHRRPNLYNRSGPCRRAWEGPSQQRASLPALSWLSLRNDRGWVVR